MFWKELAKRIGRGEGFPWENNEEVVGLQIAEKSKKYVASV